MVAVRHLDLLRHILTTHGE